MNETATGTQDPPAPDGYGVASRHRGPSFGEAFRFWLKLGFISFGGPTGQIAIMQTELVEKRKWISQSRFLHALNFCMLLPGPEAQQLAIYIGWLLHKIRGGIVAGAFFVIPSIFVLWTLSYVYAAFGNVPWIAAIFYGLKPAVTAIVLVAVIRIGRKALKNFVMWALAGLAFIAIYFFKAPFPAIVLAAGVIGFLGGIFWKAKFQTATAHEEEGQRSVISDEQESPPHTKPNLVRALSISAVCLTLWLAPTILAGVLRGWDSTLFNEGLFFSKAAVVTFGGAYAVLPYVAQQALFHYGWLKPGHMMDGLGLAETTPGPLIMVLQFVGFMGAWQHPEGLSPIVAATLGALLTTWATFTPCFLWIFVGGPHIEQLRGNQKLTAALSAVTAAIVGVILNLAVWFALHVFFPTAGSVDWFAIVLCAAAFVALLRYKIDIIPIIIASGLLGLIYRLILFR
ncbi:MAG TPA: chromate efflux transporter [Chthoniobacterales bacterium]|jgi:chromate transporter, chromate ion transporter (CHR) family|nr:chromate efflux transporter [Chthoniobacterales bacterium]